MARARGYADAPAAVFAARGLDPSSVRDLIRRVREHGEVSRRLARIQRSAPSWAKPRIPFDSASAIIRSALAPLGPEYGHELAALLDPANCRLDIGPGPTRQATGFSWENPDQTTGVYLYFFDGSVRDVSRLAHESGHAMHRRLMSLSRVPRVYTGGPLLAEPAAQFNELLVTDYLARTAAETATRAAALARFLAVALDAAYGAQDADLELQVYDSVATGSVHSADDLDRISARVDSAYDVPEDGDAAGHRWMRVSLMWEDPLYLSNYMYSGMLALAYFTRFASDSARFVPAYLSLLRGGWPAPAQQLLQRQLGMSIADTSLVTATFRSLQPRLEALDRLYRGK
jgi:oligoendopeptidase F